MQWEVLESPAIIPLSYKYEISSWLYKLMASGNSPFATFLHEKGYEMGHRKFKFFTFSDLSIPRSGREIWKDRLVIHAPYAQLTLSVFIPQLTQALLAGSFSNEEFSIGDRVSKGRFRLSSIQASPLPPLSSPLKLRTDSPLVVDTFNPERPESHQYLHPEHELFGKVLLQNLLNKYQTAQIHGLTDKILYAPELAFRLLDHRSPKRKTILIKAHTRQAHRVVGYFCDFEITAPPLLLQFGLLAGLGNKNAQGFGFVNPIYQLQTTS